MKRVFRYFICAMVLAVALVSCVEPAEEPDAKFSIYDLTGETPKSVDVPAEGLTGYKLRVMAGDKWTLKISDGSEWITASMTAGSKGVREVSVDFAKNEELVPRNGRMDFVCDSETISIAVYQEKGEKPEDVTPPDPVDPPVTPPVSNVPEADILNVMFNNDGTAYDIYHMQSRMHTKKKLIRLNLMSFLRCLASYQFGTAINTLASNSLPLN